MLFSLYCLPGKILAYIAWLYPEGRGSSSGTGRRKKNKFGHFVTSTSLYILIALLYFWSHQKDFRTKSVAAVAQANSPSPSSGSKIRKHSATYEVGAPDAIPPLEGLSAGRSALAEQSNEVPSEDVPAQDTILPVSAQNDAAP